MQERTEPLASVPSTVSVSKDTAIDHMDLVQRCQRDTSTSSDKAHLGCVGQLVEESDDDQVGQVHETNSNSQYVGSSVELRLDSVRGCSEG